MSACLSSPPGVWGGRWGSRERPGRPMVDSQVGRGLVRVGSSQCDVASHAFAGNGVTTTPQRETTMPRTCKFEAPPPPSTASSSWIPRLAGCSVTPSGPAPSAATTRIRPGRSAGNSTSREQRRRQNASPTITTSAPVSPQTRSCGPGHAQPDGKPPWRAMLAAARFAGWTCRGLPELRNMRGCANGRAGDTTARIT